MLKVETRHMLYFELSPRKTLSKVSISKSSKTTPSGTGRWELSALPVIPLRCEPGMLGGLTSTLTLRFHFRIRIKRITTRRMQRAKKPPIEIPKIIIGFLYQLFLGADTGGPSVLSLVDTLVLLLSTGEELKGSVNKLFIVSRAIVFPIIYSIFFFAIAPKTKQCSEILFKGWESRAREKRTFAYGLAGLQFDVIFEMCLGQETVT